MRQPRNVFELLEDSAFHHLKRGDLGGCMKLIEALEEMAPDQGDAIGEAIIQRAAAYWARELGKSPMRPYEESGTPYFSLQDEAMAALKSGDVVGFIEAIDQIEFWGPEGTN